MLRGPRRRELRTSGWRARAERFGGPPPPMPAVSPRKLLRPWLCQAGSFRGGGVNVCRVQGMSTEEKHRARLFLSAPRRRPATRRGTRSRSSRPHRRPSRIAGPGRDGRSGWRTGYVRPAGRLDAVVQSPGAARGERTPDHVNICKITDCMATRRSLRERRRARGGGPPAAGQTITTGSPASTRSNTATASAGRSRTQPWLHGSPIRSAWLVPWR